MPVLVAAGNKKSCRQTKVFKKSMVRTANSIWDKSTESSYNDYKKQLKTDVRSPQSGKHSSTDLASLFHVKRSYIKETGCAAKALTLHQLSRVSPCSR